MKTEFNEFKIDEIRDREFTIPFYQREYAWESENLQALIKDAQSSLYIGNIVVKNNLIIDGQQRLVSLYLLAKFTGKEIYKIKYAIDDSDNAKLESLNFGDKNENFDFAMQSLNDICRFIARNIKEDETKKCLENVYFTITELPESINAGRYFEVMNTNKQQLKQHEILKAKFVEKLQNININVAEIWDNCADMDSYFMQNELYEKNGELKKFELRKFDCNENKPEVHSKNPTINEFLNSKEILNENNENKKDYVLKSIVKFENFLAIVGKILDDDMLLSTKNLVRNFEEKILCDFEKSKNFIKALFEYRNLFDKFIFKRQGDEHIQQFGDKNLLMLQLLFEAQNSDEWLVSYLQFCKENSDCRKHIKFLENLAMEKACEFDFDKGAILDMGTATPHYVFYFLEYHLWKDLNSEDKIWENAKINKKNLYENYKISRLNSVEHIHPQSKVNQSGFSNEKELDNFGNLALLSSSRNSSLGNLEVNEKLARVENWLKMGNAQSLKMILALKENLDWNFESVKNHREKMVNYYKSKIEN